MPKKYINPNSLFPSAKFGFSQIVTTQGGKTVYLSGQVPFDAEEKLIGTNRREQMQQCLRNVKTAIKEVGGLLEDVVLLRIYMVNYDADTEGETVTEVIKEFFNSDRLPATTWIGISALAVKDFLVEIEAIAVIE